MEQMEIPHLSQTPTSLSLSFSLLYHSLPPILLISFFFLSSLARDDDDGFFFCGWSERAVEGEGSDRAEELGEHVLYELCSTGDESYRCARVCVCNFVFG